MGNRVLLVEDQDELRGQLVALLQTHAAEVSDLAKRGMQAVHEQMGPNHHR